MDETEMYTTLRKIDRSSGPARMEAGDVSTQTIDLNSLFAEDVYSTGTFDLRSIESTSLGMLLDAIPIPACLVDQWYTVVFSNQAWGKIIGIRESEDYASFLDFLPRPPQPDKAKRLLAKAEKLLQNAFDTRIPKQAEIIFDREQRRMWCRLHLRAVRIRSQRHLLILVEDVTAERARQRLAQREVTALRKSPSELESQVKELSGQIGETRKIVERDSETSASPAENLSDLV